MERNPVVGLAAALLLAACSGCISTGRFATGRTLDPGQVNAAIGVQNAAVKQDEGWRTAANTQEFAPSLGLRVGLPARLEFGILAVFPGQFEFGLRFEPTPRDFKLFDFALGLSGGTHWFSSGYWRFEATVSHRFGGLEPYAYMSRYANGGDWGDDADDHWLDEIVDDLLGQAIRSTRTVGLGVALPLTDILRVVPEVRYDWYSSDPGWGFEGGPGSGYLGVAVVLGPWKPKVPGSSRQGSYEERRRRWTRPGW